MAAADYSAAFTALKPVLGRYASRLYVRVDKPDHYYLETKSRSYKGERTFFAGIRAGKSHVSFYLMPVYSYPGLLKGISPGLKRRMHGKSCFNFTDVDPKLIAELKKLTEAGFKKYGEENLL